MKRQVTAEELSALTDLATKAHARAHLLEVRLAIFKRTFEKKMSLLGLHELYASRAAVKRAINAMYFIGYKLDSINAGLICDNWKAQNKKK